MDFMTENQRRKIVDQLRAKLQRQTDALQATQAQLDHFAQLELPLETKSTKK